MTFKPLQLQEVLNAVVITVAWVAKVSNGHKLHFLSKGQWCSHFLLALITGYGP